jgi:legumain
MPTGMPVYADELGQTLDKMKAKGMYSELVFYIEACESGSMFPNLKADSGVYAMTASNEKVSSWAAYCGEHSTV